MPKETPNQIIGVASPCIVPTYPFALCCGHWDGIHPQLSTQFLPLLQPSCADTAQVDGVLPQEVDMFFLVALLFAPSLGFGQTVKIPKEREMGVRDEVGIGGEIIMV